MEAQLAMFGVTMNEVSPDMEKLKKEFKSLWLTALKEDGVSDFFGVEKSKNIVPMVQKFLSVRGVYSQVIKGMYQNNDHSWLVVPTQEGEIIVDPQRRQFSDFLSRLGVVYPHDKQYRLYSVEQRKLKKRNSR